MLFAAPQFLFQRLIGCICFASGPSQDARPPLEEVPLSSGGLLSEELGSQANVDYKSPGKIVKMQMQMFSLI